MSLQDKPADFLADYNQNRMSPFDLAALTDLLAQFGRRDLTTLEIGSWFGAGSTQVLANYSARLVCVDHWMGNDNDTHRQITQHHGVFSHFQKNTARFADKIVPIRGDSARVCPLLREKTFDFIFIDGDHRYAQTRRDIAACQALVAPGGILSGHDCETRLTAENSDYVRQNADMDNCPSRSASFTEWHCGVILALSELVPDANLFADTPILVDGQTGCSTIWHHRQD